MAEEVKYLSFIQQYAESLYGYAEAGYSKLKTHTLTKVPAQFKDLIDSVEERLKPVLSSILVPYSLSILLFADGLVETGVALGSDAFASAQTKSKDAVENLKGRVQKTLENEYVEDVKNTAQAKYSSAHGAIISSPTYAQLYAATLNYTKWACSLPILRKPAEMLYSNAYPRVKSVVDPVVTNVEPYMKALEEHLEPRAGNSTLAVSSDSETSTKGEE